MSSKEENKKLSAKEQRFCYEYVLHLNATKAAIGAGYAENSARQTGYRLLTNDYIQNRISHLKNNLAETSGISALRIVKEHEKIAFSSIAHLHNTWIERVDFDKLSENQKACIKSISTKIIKKNVGTKEEPDIVDIEYVKIELYDKQKSLDGLSKMLGYEIQQGVDKNNQPDENATKASVLLSDGTEIEI